MCLILPKELQFLFSIAPHLCKQIVNPLYLLALQHYNLQLKNDIYVSQIINNKAILYTLLTIMLWKLISIYTSNVNLWWDSIISCDKYCTQMIVPANCIHVSKWSWLHLLQSKLMMVAHNSVLIWIRKLLYSQAYYPIHIIMIIIKVSIYFFTNSFQESLYN